MSTAREVRVQYQFGIAAHMTLVSSFAEWLHAIIYGGPGEPPGSCQVSSGQWCQPEPGHRGKILSILLEFMCSKDFL